MNIKKRIVIIGATSAIATACARKWLSDAPAEMILVGRGFERLNRTAKDLQSRNADSDIQIRQSNLSNITEISATVDEITDTGMIDIVLIAHGSLSDQALCQNDLEVCAQELQINAISPVIFAEAFANHFENQNHGTLAIISSVAGDRGRKSNYVYGAAKGLITRYAQGLQHRFANTNVKIVLIKPGPTDTPMTSALKANGAKLEPVDNVAACITKGIGNGTKTIYAPGKWQIIMMIIRHLPSFIFNKMNI